MLLPPSFSPGYDEGNLNWLAAFEVEPASDVMALRVWKTEELTPMQAQVGWGQALLAGLPRRWQARAAQRKARRGKRSAAPRLCYTRRPKH